MSRWQEVEVGIPLPNVLTSKRAPQRGPDFFAVDAGVETDLLPRGLFMKMLCLERDRVERSDRRLVLMLVESPLLKHGDRTDSAKKIQSAVSRATRQTDIKGWYRDEAVIGVIFTEIPRTETSIVPILSRKVNDVFQTVLDAQHVSEVDLSFHVFPDLCEGDNGGTGDPATFSTIYPDVVNELESKRIPLLVKRCLDIAGSLLALIILSPLISLVAAVIKLTSPGPVLFRQIRLGQRGQSFTFLKFRSMYAKADHAIHESYIKSFISNKTESPANEGGAKIYKLQADPRITPVGRFLRRTSLDEIPQFFSVLIGHMSLVGPRPPVPYEFAAYKTWHRRRLLAVKPGITGFWQVEGRSRVKFDDMVRMDIEYARTWSLWMDVKIILRTPRAVLGGNGAY
jgi:lipopolysaccharide/colanic/teichoic acid biosynthesis glycosyltransferase